MSTEIAVAGYQTSRQNMMKVVRFVVAGCCHTATMLRRRAS
jgi:hypothetical protein